MSGLHRLVEERAVDAGGFALAAGSFAAAGTITRTTKVAGDAQPRYWHAADGSQELGDGTTAQGDPAHVRMFYAGAKTLKYAWGDGTQIGIVGPLGSYWGKGAVTHPNVVLFSGSNDSASVDLVSNTVQTNNLYGLYVAPTHQYTQAGSLAVGIVGTYQAVADGTARTVTIGNGFWARAPLKDGNITFNSTYAFFYDACTIGITNYGYVGELSGATVGRRQYQAAGTESSSGLVQDDAVIWNNGATTATAVRLNVTDTASAADSLLLDLQVGGASKFRVGKAGDVNHTGINSGVISRTSRVTGDVQPRHWQFTDGAHEWADGNTAQGNAANIRLVRNGGKTMQFTWGDGTQIALVGPLGLFVGANAVTHPNVIIFSGSNDSTKVDLVSNSGTTTSLYGAYIAPTLQFAQSGSLAVGVVGSYQIITDGTARTITLAYGFYGRAPVKGAGVTLNSHYAFFAEATTVGVTNYGYVGEMSGNSTGRRMYQAAGTESSSGFVQNDAVTWNAGGTTATAWKLNVTDTASAAGSLLVDLQKGAVSQFKVGKAGDVTLTGALTTGAPGGAAAPWKLGSVVAAAVAFDAANYVEAMIGGVVKKLALAA